MSQRSGRDHVPLLLLVWAFLVLGLVGCAEVASPPGGEADKTSPFLVGSIPENGAVNVGQGNTITLFFSERIVKPSSGKPVFISPRPLQQPKLKWKSNRIEIVLPDSFRTNETYIISLSSSIVDLRGNKLDSSSIIAFSTGPSIDSGKVAGHVYSKDRPISGLIVALYRASAFQDSTVVFDSLYPDYVSQSNKEGFFAFEYLPEREYRLVAFDDKNRNERFNPALESFALADRPIIVGSEIPLNSLQLSLTTQDTVSAEIISAVYTADRLLKVRLSREIPLELLRRSPSNLMLRWQEDGTRVFPCNSFLESDEDNAAVLNCYFGLLSEGMYNLELTYDISRPSIHYRNVEAKPVEDMNAPTVARFYPGNVPQFVDQVEIQAVFSEPLDTTKISVGTFNLWEDPDTRVTLSRQWRDAFHLLLHPVELKEGATYRLAVTEFEITDLAGNVLGDSLREYPFSILASDSLGSVSGEVVIDIAGKENSPVVLSFRHPGGRQILDLPVSGREFKVDLPGGNYLLSGFVDSDLDGQKGNGAIYPFRLAETSAAYPDTISVRPRFETTGIRFEFR